MHHECDVAVIGGGLVGLSLVCALQRTGLRLALVEPRPLPPVRADGTWDSRVYALSPGTAAFLDTLGVWPRLPAERLTRVETMEIYGDDDAARLEFSAYDAGLRELAFIVEHRLLARELWHGIGSGAVELCCPASCVALESGPERVTLTLADGKSLAARLVVGADGADSWVRERAGIAMTPWDYRQLGVVANFSCEKSHHGVAYQWFQRGGNVLALLPLAGNRVSMVWSIAQERGERLLGLAADELAAEVQAATRGVLGDLSVITPAAGFPLRLQRVAQFARPRIALVGDAAHNVHPLAGQGVNLGFRDARELAAALDGPAARYDCGDYPLLRRYERARKEDAVALQLTTHGLQKLFGSGLVTVARARNAGLKLVDRQPQLKNFLVRQAVA